MKRGKPAADVDEYLAGIPPKARAAEVISYQIPAYKLQGIPVGFAALPNHCTFHVMSPEVMRTHADELKGYEVGKGSIRFPADKPMSTALVTKLVKARIAENQKRGTHR